MTRPWFAWALCAALAACAQSTSLPKFVVLDPIFDSVFVGNQRPLPNVIYFDGDKLQTPPASAVTWQSSAPTVLAVNNPSGQIKGLKRGSAFVGATVEGTQGSEIVAVPDTVDITLLVDTLYLLPGDTMTIPTIILHRDPRFPRCLTIRLPTRLCIRSMRTAASPRPAHPAVPSPNPATPTT